MQQKSAQKLDALLGWNCRTSTKKGFFLRFLLKNKGGTLANFQKSAAFFVFLLGEFRSRQAEGDGKRLLTATQGREKCGCAARARSSLPTIRPGASVSSSVCIAQKRGTIYVPRPPQSMLAVPPCLSWSVPPRSAPATIWSCAQGLAHRLTRRPPRPFGGPPRKLRPQVHRRTARGRRCFDFWVGRLHSRLKWSGPQWRRCM